MYWYLPRMSRRKEPLMPGRIMAVMLMKPERVINHRALGVCTGTSTVTAHPMAVPMAKARISAPTIGVFHPFGKGVDAGGDEPKEEGPGVEGLVGQEVVDQVGEEDYRGSDAQSQGDDKAQMDLSGEDVLGVTDGSP